MVSRGMWLSYNQFLPPTSYNIVVISLYTSNSIHPLYNYYGGIFPTQGLNLGLLHCRQILYHLSHQGSLNYPYII